MDGNPFFEKSLFDAMRQNRLTGEKRYLDNAIDAQHGEFPSRLLDVSYNCLTALYFAVTPYYRCLLYTSLEHHSIFHTILGHQFFLSLLRIHIHAAELIKLESLTVFTYPDL